MSMAVGPSGGQSANINVTPLIDVLLVLLIIFMVITPMLQRGKPVQLPQANELSALKSGGDPIMVSVTRDGRIWVDKVEYEKDALVEALNAQMAMHPGSPVLVKGDKGSSRSACSIASTASSTRPLDRSRVPSPTYPNA